MARLASESWRFQQGSSGCQSSKPLSLQEFPCAVSWPKGRASDLRGEPLPQGECLWPKGRAPDPTEVSSIQGESHWPKGKAPSPRGAPQTQKESPQLPTHHSKEDWPHWDTQTHRQTHRHTHRPGGAPLTPWSHPVHKHDHISPHWLGCFAFCPRLKYLDWLPIFFQDLESLFGRLMALGKAGT